MVNYWFKIKGYVLPIFFFLIANAYLIYLLTRYVIDNTISTLFILITNEIFIFIGILFYLIYSSKIKIDNKIKEYDFLMRKLKNRVKRLEK